jgi:hypothetical protein
VAWPVHRRRCCRTGFVPASQSGWDRERQGHGVPHQAERGIDGQAVDPHDGQQDSDRRVRPPGLGAGAAGQALPSVPGGAAHAPGDGLFTGVQVRDGPAAAQRADRPDRQKGCHLRHHGLRVGGADHTACHGEINGASARWLDRSGRPCEPAGLGRKGLPRLADRYGKLPTGTIVWQTPGRTGRAGNPPTNAAGADSPAAFSLVGLTPLCQKGD